MQILNNVVHDNAHWSAFGNSGISVSTSANLDNGAQPHILIEGNLVYNNQQLVPTIGSNTITDGEGIILDTNPGYTGGFLVQNNTVYNNGGPGIESFLSNNAVIAGNTLDGNNVQHTQSAINAEVFTNQSQNNTVTDNSISLANNHPPSITSLSPDTTGANTIHLTGTAAAGSVVTVLDNSANVGMVTTDTAGNWSFTESNAAWTLSTGSLVAGIHNFTAINTDTAGNVSAASPALAIAIVLGSPGDDVLGPIGTPGNYVLTGNGGQDTYVLAGNNFGKLVITDFQPEGPGTMSFNLANQNLANLSVAQVGSNVVIATDPADTVTLLGISLNDLSISNFKFV